MIKIYQLIVKVFFLVSIFSIAFLFIILWVFECSLYVYYYEFIIIIMLFEFIWIYYCLLYIVDIDDWYVVDVLDNGYLLGK